LLLRSVAWLFSYMPHRLRWWCATASARIACVLRVRRILIAEDNIRTSFPDYTEEEVKKTAFSSAQNLFQVFFEMPFIARASRRQLMQFIRADNNGEIKELLAHRKKAVFISGHYGNWECIALSGPLLLDCPVTIVVKPQRNVRINAMLESMRSRFGNTVIPMEGSIRKMMHLLDDNKSVALLADQSATRQDIFVDFFGRSAPTYKTAAALSLRFHAPLIFGMAKREAGFYRVHYQEIPSADLGGPTEENIRILTERHVKVLETAIRENPGHWSWYHRRWKHTKMTNG